MPESVGLAWYTTGTVTVTQGSLTVTGVGTNWVNAGLKTGDIFTMDRVTLYEIAFVDSNTSLTLKQAYTAASATAANYYIIRNFAATLPAELAAQVSNLVAGYEAWKDGRVSEIAIPFDFSSLYKGVWRSGASYKALDIVMYNTALYVCTTAHTSSDSILPTNTAYWSSYAPAMPASIDVLNYNNAGSHNALFRGKNLGPTLTAAQISAINAGTFDDLYIGDYWTRTITYSYTDPDDGDATKSETITPVMRIADFDYFYLSGDVLITTKHGLIVVPDAILFSAQMNPTNDTTGAYAGSKMRTKYLARAEAIFNEFFGAEHVVSYRDLLQNAVTNGKPSAGSWYDCKVELMSEPMVYGGFVFDPANDGVNVPYRRTISCKQLNLFRHCPELMFTNSSWCWLRDVVSAVSFARVSNTGNSHYYNASVAGGVRPAALIC